MPVTQGKFAGIGERGGGLRIPLVKKLNRNHNANRSHYLFQ
jgi:hypothetical protein